MLIALNVMFVGVTESIGRKVGSWGLATDDAVTSCYTAGGSG